MTFHARPSGTVPLPDAASVVGGHALLRHPSGSRHALLRDAGTIRLVDLLAAFDGAPGLLAVVPDPWPGWRNGVRGASADGSLIVLAGQRSVLALEADGRARWEYRHGCWGDGPHAHGGADGPCHGLWSGSCAVSPDGTLVWAHVLPDLDHGDPAVDSYEEWLILDAADGAVLGRTRLEGGTGGSNHLPYPDGARMLLSTGQGQDGTPAYLGHWDGTELTVREVGDGFRIPVDVHPGGRAFLSTPHGRDGLQLHRSTDGLVVMERAAGDLAADGDEAPLWDYVAGFVDGHTVIAAAHDAGRREDRRHWLLDALTLRPLGPVAYPRPVGGYPLALGDGSWLTLDAEGSALLRWKGSRTAV
ncbi:hypothetical protein [Kitasatospora sp. KL5]|uniref:hypothetical protein n=1 Tax=Kitasatospora sp. KL5 TaxID=3425125 RepID=UPI003D6E5B0A